MTMEAQAPAKRPRVGYAATPAPPPPPPVVLVAPPVYYVGPGYILAGAPYLVLSDGSVAVNFGNGYERVLRPCQAQHGGVRRAGSDGRDPLGRILPPPGIAALAAGTRGVLGGPMPARTSAACYSVEGGRAVVR